ncbi:FG-GAP repeat domain-containing protein [Lunatimonas salinarum]|uniref:FG-GAP repeat domain-containing protein n=1 Tax=Lunatimonas salinarum TaxID=1774590 RepID=UPI001ADF864B|nr:VCBS repeat-containing protein [Lunatimonas salinarum]
MKRHFFSIRTANLLYFAYFLVGVDVFGMQQSSPNDIFSTVVPDTTRQISPLSYQNPSLLVDLGVGLWAWPLPMDWNEDGLMDLVVVCTDRPSNGIHVFLQSGETDPTTLLPIFEPSFRIGAAGRSPQISYHDEGYRVTTSGAYYPDFKNSGFDHPQMLGNPESIHPEEGRIRANQWKFVDFNGNGVLDLIVGTGFWGEYGWDDAWDSEGNWKNGPLRGYTYLLENHGTDAQPDYAAPRRIHTTSGEPIDVYGMPSPNFADFDLDGDLDLLCGEFLDGFTYFENVGNRNNPLYAPGKKLTIAGVPLRMELCMITPTVVDFIGNGILDLVVGDEDGRVALLEGTGAVLNGVPQFLPPRYFKQRADKVKFGALAAPVSVDWDGDGLEDLIVGNTAGYVGFIKNMGGDPPLWATPVYLADQHGVIREQAGSNGSIQGPAEAKWGYTNPSVGDWDGDGLPDIVTNGIWGKVLFYKNIGTRTAPKLASGVPVEVDYNGPTPTPDWTWWKPEGKELVTQWRTTPHLIDWNGDSLMDLVMLDQEGYLAFFERKRKSDGSLGLAPPQRVFWGEGVSAYDGSGRPQNEDSGLLRMNQRQAGGSGRRTFTFFDWDHDGVLDILVNSATNVNVLKGLGKDSSGRWRFKDSGPVHHKLLAAHSTTPTIAQWAGNRYLIIGAEDGYFYYLPVPETLK